VSVSWLVTGTTLPTTNTHTIDAKDKSSGYYYLSVTKASLVGPEKM
jgi:hypothetical protein